MTTESEPVSAIALKKWLSDNGSSFHPDTRFSEDEFGLRIMASKDLPRDTCVVSCSFSLIITKASSKASIADVLGLSDSTLESLSGWTERQWIATYLSFHWIIESPQTRLAHHTYLNTLPTPDMLRTPLHFTTLELDLLRGSNIYGATLEREGEWKAEWEQCRLAVKAANAAWGESYTWDRYLTAATYISSRAFPSSILSSTPTLVASPETEPVLIPGVDSLNHARGKKVSWLVSHPNGEQSPESTISLIHHDVIASHHELFNNYGPKPNSELLLGYGFTLPENPDDTILLKVGGSDSGGQKWEIGRNARGADGLWNEILSKFKAPDAAAPSYEDVLDASNMLQEMTETLIDRLPVFDDQDTEDIRPEVLEMLQQYLEGQRDILQSLFSFAQTYEQHAVELAREQGVDLVLDDK